MSTTTRRTLDLTSTDDEFWFNDACDALTAMLDDLNPDSDTYHSHGENVGWRNQHGTTTLTLTDGRDLLQKLTPNADWNLTATLHDDRLTLDLSHHDSPTGETHVLTPA